MAIESRARNVENVSLLTGMGPIICLCSGCRNYYPTFTCISQLAIIWLLLLFLQQIQRRDRAQFDRLAELLSEEDNR